MMTEKSQQKARLDDLEKKENPSDNIKKNSGPAIVYARPFKYKKNKEHGVMIYITKDFRQQVEPFVDKLCRIEIKLAE